MPARGKCSQGNDDLAFGLLMSLRKRWRALSTGVHAKITPIAILMIEAYKRMQPNPAFIADF